MPDGYASLRSDEAMKRRAETVRRQQAAAVRTQARVSNAKTMTIVLMGAGLAWSVWNNNRLATKADNRETVYAVLQPNGEFIASTHYKSIVPTLVQGDNVTEALWTYVKARDCYNSADFAEQAYVAQAMSDARVGKEVHNQFNLTNPDAPQHLYGEHGITVHCKLIDPPQKSIMGNQYLFRFQRWLDDGHPVKMWQVPFYTVAVSYRTGVYPKFDPQRSWYDRSVFNAPGVQVIEYPGAQPENAEPVKEAQP